MSTTVLTPAAPEVADASEALTVRAVEPEPSDAVRPEPEVPPRRFTAWDAVGVLVSVWVMLVVNRVGVAVMNTPLGRSPVIDSVTVAVMAAAVGSLTMLVVWERPSPAVLIRSLTAVWRDPPVPSLAFVLGGILTIPVFGLYYPGLFDDADSGRLIASMQYVEQGHLEYFADTQEPFLHHVLLSPVMAVAGLGGVKAAVVFSLLVLGGVVAYVAYRLTGVMWAAGAAAVALLCITATYERAVRVPMYPTMLALGYLGGWLAYRALSEPHSRWRYAVPAGLCLALAQEAQGVGQLFLAVPLLVAIFAPGLRSALLQLLRVSAGMALVLIPRFAVNFAEGGLAFVTSSRTDYWITEGYVDRIQVELWRYQGVNEGVGEYLGKLPDRLVYALGDQAWLVLSCAGIGWLVGCRGRSRWFVPGALLFFAAAITVKPIPPFPRYYSPVWPGVAILTGVLFAALFRRRRHHLGTWALRGVGVGLSTVLVVAASLSYQDAVEANDGLRRAIELQPYAELAEAIDDGKGVIGARSTGLLAVAPDIPTWGHQFLTEREYVTYLSWPSDAAVIAMLERHDIGWVLVHRQLVLEIPYNNTWLEPEYGVTARHPQALAASPNFCRYMEKGGFLLYKLGPCPDAYPA